MKGRSESPESGAGSRRRAAKRPIRRQSGQSRAFRKNIAQALAAAAGKCAPFVAECARFQREIR